MRSQRVRERPWLDRLHELLRRLRPERRREVIASKLSQQERLTLEEWLTARRAGADRGAGTEEGGAPAVARAVPGDFPDDALLDACEDEDEDEESSSAAPPAAAALCDAAPASPRSPSPERAAGRSLALGRCAGALVRRRRRAALFGKRAGGRLREVFFVVDLWRGRSKSGERVGRNFVPKWALRVAPWTKESAEPSMGGAGVLSG